MVVIRNITKNSDVIEFDYYPENDNIKGHIKYNHKTKSIISQTKTEVVHGLDLPEEVTKRNIEIMMEELGITEEEINSVDFEYEDWYQRNSIVVKKDT